MLVGAVFFLVPLPVFGALEITEIMYDAEGSDPEHEWIEITNTGKSAVDLSQFRFFEGGVNHKLKIVQGSAIVQASTSAIIAENAESFKDDWPKYAGTLFDSAFSLSNTGESLALKKGTEIVFSTEYTSSFGAKGDGSSLHKVGDSWTDALPTPGIYPGELKKQEKKSREPSATSAKSYATSSLAGIGFSPSSKTLGMGAGLGAIIFIGIAGALLVPKREKKEETFPSPDEFEIVE